MALAPSPLDPNFKAETERKKRDPFSFGDFGAQTPAPAKKPSAAEAETKAAAEAETKAAAEAEEAAQMAEFLNQSIHDIVPELAAMDEAQLLKVLAAEEADKARKGLLEAINEELTERKEG